MCPIRCRACCSTRCGGSADAFVAVGRHSRAARPGLQLRLYDSADRQVCPPCPARSPPCTSAASPRTSATHLGHAATYLTFDLVYRMAGQRAPGALRQNVTDVDDPLFRTGRARRGGLARPGRAGDNCSARIWRRCGCCRRRFVGPPGDRRSRRNGGETAGVGGRHVLDDPDHRTCTSGPTPTCSSATRSITTATPCCDCSPNVAATRSAREADPLDALLWRTERQVSRVGRRRSDGRPGWHVECAAIALSRIGFGFDVRGGGSDLIFPHHEFSAAHAMHDRPAQVRAALRARRNDRVGRPQDVEESGQSCWSPGCVPLGWTQPRSDSACCPGITAVTGSGPMTYWPGRFPSATLAHGDRLAGQPGRGRSGRAVAALPRRRSGQPQSPCRRGWLGDRRPGYGGRYVKAPRWSRRRSMRCSVSHCSGDGRWRSRWTRLVDAPPALPNGREQENDAESDHDRCRAADPGAGRLRHLQPGRTPQTASTPSATGGPVTPDQARASPRRPTSTASRWSTATGCSTRTSSTRRARVQGPWNEVHSAARLFTPADTTVQTPNSDTPYSMLGADLRAEPLVLLVPPISDRYYSLQFIDGYTYNFAYVGGRTTGTDGVPACRTGLERPEARGHPRGHQGRHRFRAGRLPDPTAGSRRPGERREDPGRLPGPTAVDLPEEECPGAGPGDRLPDPAEPRRPEDLADLLRSAGLPAEIRPTLASEKDIRARFSIGLTGDGTFDSGKLSPDMQKAFQDGMSDAWAEFATFRRTRSTPVR